MDPSVCMGVPERTQSTLIHSRWRLGRFCFNTVLHIIVNGCHVGIVCWTSNRTRLSGQLLITSIPKRETQRPGGSWFEWQSKNLAVWKLRGPHGARETPISSDPERLVPGCMVGSLGSKLGWQCQEAEGTSMASPILSLSSYPADGVGLAPPPHRQGNQHAQLQSGLGAPPAECEAQVGIVQ